MILVIIGIEGSGHHFVLDLFRNSSSNLTIESHTDSQNQQNLNDEILNNYLKVFPDENISNNFKSDEISEFNSFYEKFEILINKYSHQPDILQILDLSIPFHKGKNRHLRVVDYFKLSKLLNPINTKIIYLKRDLVSVSRSVYSRKIEDSIIEACYSSQNSLTMFNQATKYFTKFPQHIIDYNKFSKDIDGEISLLEQFFDNKIKFDKGQFKLREVNFENDEFFKSFWNDRESYFL